MDEAFISIDSSIGEAGKRKTVMAKKATPDKMERLEHKQALARRSFRYTRFLPLRYALALFCFTNVYWAALIFTAGVTWIVPAFIFLLGFPAVFEQVKLLTVTTLDITNELKFTKIFFLFQLMANVVLIVIILSGFGFEAFYPFLTTYMSTRVIMAGIVGLGGLIAMFCLGRISKIHMNTDKHYSYIIEMEKAVAQNRPNTKKK